MAVNCLPQVRGGHSERMAGWKRKARYVEEHYSWNHLTSRPPYKHASFFEKWRFLLRRRSGYCSPLWTALVAQCWCVRAGNHYASADEDVLAPVRALIPGLQYSAAISAKHLVRATFLLTPGPSLGASSSMTAMPLVVFQMLRLCMCGCFQNRRRGGGMWVFGRDRLRQG
jgi:hypothetical protein